MKRYLSNLKNTNGKQGGFVLAITMVALVALSFFVTTGVSTSSSTTKVAGNYTKSIESFNIAESGLAKARPLLEGSNFNDLLTNYAAAGIPLVAKTSFNKGSYIVYVADNDDGDGDMYSDSDNIVVLKAIGESQSGNTVEIEAHYQKPTASGEVALPSPPASGSGAAMMCGTSTDVRTQGAAKINGNDFAVPSLPCSGSGCEGTNLGPSAFAVVGEGKINTSGGGFVGGSSQYVSDTKCAEWKTLRNSLASLDPSHESVVVLSGSGTSAQLNDCSNPKVFIVNTSASTYHFSGSSELCGIVVVASDTSISTTGNATLIGTVLVMGESSDLNFIASSGTPRIFGQVIVESISVSKAKELEVKGTADINYSTEGIGYAQQAMNNALSLSGGGGDSGVLTIAWKETY